MKGYCGYYEKNITDEMCEFCLHKIGDVCDNFMKREINENNKRDHLTL